jgi:hypothetical protein
MDALIVAPTVDSPEVLFDPNSTRLTVSGESRPEHAEKFYAPIIKWIGQFESFLHQRQNEKRDELQIVFEFKFKYFNSSSAKFILDMILAVKKLVDGNYNVIVEWKYGKLDEDVLEAGREFSEISDLPFTFLAY